MPVTRIAISKLKAKLSEHIAAVRGGKEIIVTDRGQPVARIVPIAGAREAEARVAALVREGRIRPPTAARPLDAARLLEGAPKDPTASTRRHLIDERRSGR